jgi:Autophagy-related protein 101
MLIESKVNAFVSSLDSLPPSPDPPAGTIEIEYGGTVRSQIAIQFYEKVTRRASWWGSKNADSEVCWEKWELNCEFLPVASNRTAHGIFAHVYGAETL